MERKAHYGIVKEEWVTRTTQIEPRIYEQIQRILYTENKSLRKFLNEVLIKYFSEIRKDQSQTDT